MQDKAAPLIGFVLLGQLLWNSFYIDYMITWGEYILIKKSMESSYFTENFKTKIQELVSGKEGVSVTCGILHNSQIELKMWDGEGEQNYQSQKYEIGSITKTFTGILLCEAIMLGKASLKDNLVKWMPELDNKKHWPTLEQLVTHTSGFPEEDETNVDMNYFERNNYYMDWTREKMIEMIQKLDLENKTYPGLYSNLGAATIGLVLERIHEKSYKELICELLQRYGLNNTKIYTTENIGLPGICQNGQVCDNWKWPEECGMASAGALISTPEDLLKYGEILLNQHDPAVKLAMKPITQVSKEGDEPTIEIGCFIMYFTDGKIYFHNGGTGCFNSALAIDIEKGIVMVFLSNCYLEKDANFIVSELYHRKKQ